MVSSILDNIRAPKRTAPYLLGFRDASRPGDIPITYQAIPDVPFRIKGLMAWGATDESRILECRVGNRVHLMASVDHIPLRFFETGNSFEDILKLCDPDSAPSDEQKHFQSILSNTPHVKPRQLFEFDTLVPGMSLKITIKGPCSALVFFGIAEVFDDTIPAPPPDEKPKAE